MSYEIISKKSFSGAISSGEAWIIKLDNVIRFKVSEYDDEEYETQYFVVSGAMVMFSGWEVLVFAAKDETGEWLSATEIVGGGGYTYEEAIDELLDWSEEQDVVNG